MPSPLGHTLAGLAVGWLSEPARPAPTPLGSRVGRLPVSRFVFWCAVLAAIPDADLLIPNFHRTATHSVTATALVLIIGVAVTGKVTRHRAWRFVLALTAAYATHLLLDWLGVDQNRPSGLQMLWPFSRTFFISGLDLFPPTAREDLTMRMILVNAHAALWELILVGPVAFAAWAIHRARRRQAYT